MADLTTTLNQPDSQLTGAIRDLLKIAGVSLAAKGIIDQSTAAILPGIAIAIGSVLWSVWQRRHAATVIATALDMNKGSSRDQLDRRVETDLTPVSAAR